MDLKDKEGKWTLQAMTLVALACKAFPDSTLKRVKTLRLISGYSLNELLKLDKSLKMMKGMDL